MTKKRLVIYGIGKYAEYVQYVFENDSEYEVVGFCIEKSHHSSTELNGLPLVVFEHVEDIFHPSVHSLFIAVGQNLVRKRIYSEAKNKLFILPNYISSKSVTWKNLTLGDNCFIGEGTEIQPFVEIGNNSIHFGSRIGHHCKIGNHTLLSSPTLGGNVYIGDDSYLGINSTIKQNVRIAERNIIGMNVTIEQDTLSDSVYSHRGSYKRDLTYQQVAKRFLL